MMTTTEKITKLYIDGKITLDEAINLTIKSAIQAAKKPDIKALQKQVQETPEIKAINAEIKKLKVIQGVFNHTIQIN